MDKKIIIGLIIIVLIALAGLVSFSTGIKGDTQINFLSSPSMKNGGEIQFELVDAQGNPLANQDIDIKFNGSNETQNFTITTDDLGRGGLILKDEASGNYTVSVSYGGDDKHNGCSNKQLIKIDGNDTSESSGDSTSDSTESYDDYSYSYSYSSDSGYSSQSSESSQSSGVVESGQNAGISREYLETHQPNVKDGNLE